jgi:hypothetical protein
MEPCLRSCHFITRARFVPGGDRRKSCPTLAAPLALATGSALIVLLVCGVTSAAAGRATSAGAAAPALPGIPIVAFARAATSADTAPASVARHRTIIASRRVATYTDGRGRHSQLYAVLTSRPSMLCLVLERATGVGFACGRTQNVFARSAVLLLGGRYLVGVARNDVARVDLIGSRGVRHHARLTNDGGFIYDCHAWNGCARLIGVVEAYDAAGRLVSKTGWG